MLVPDSLFYSSGFESFQCSSYLDLKASLLASGLSIVNVIAAIFWAVLIAKHEDIFFVECIKTVWLFSYLLACVHKVPQAELKVQISKQERLPSRQ